MIKAIKPQSKSQPRSGLTHASDVIARLMKIYGLESEMEELAMEREVAEQQELAAAAMTTAEFTPIPTSLPALAGSTQQDTFAWFE